MRGRLHVHLDEALGRLHNQWERVRSAAAAAGTVTVRESESAQARKLEADIEAFEALLARKKLFETSVEIRKLFPLFEKEAQLIVSRAEAPDADQRLHCDAQIDATRARREAEEQEIFLRLAQRLDYHDQEEHFGRLLRARRADRIAPAVLCGDLDGGLHWVVNRLRRQVPPSSEPPFVVQHSFRSGAVAQGITALVASFARRLGLSPSAPKEAVFEKICDKWRCTNLIFVFAQIGSLGAPGLTQLLEGFWRPLVQVAHVRRAASESTWIAAFFLHEGDTSDIEGAPLHKAPSAATGPDTPLLLPPLRPFCDSDLGRWQSACGLEFPESMQKDDALSEVLAASRGVPSDTLYAICQHWGYDFNVLLNLWEKL